MTKRIFFSFLICCFFMAIVEAVLSGLPLSFLDKNLFVLSEKDSLYHVNRDFPSNYFFSDFLSSNITGDCFSANKERDDFRIAFLGGSSTAGFPHPFNASFPFFYEFILRKWFPQKNIKVLNLGASALSSYAVSDIASRLSPYSPDLVFCYLGHNEFYGNMGSANKEVWFGGYAFKKFYLKMGRLNLVRLIKYLAQKIVFRESASTLMESVFNRNPIKYRSELFKRTIRDYEKNILEIKRILSKEEIPLVFCSIVSNTKDFPPFLSYLKDDLDPKNSTFSKGQAISRMSGDSIKKMLERYPEHAELNYYFAKKSDFLTKKERTQYLKRAYVHDGLRFRAPPEINEALRRLFKNNEIERFCDVEKKLQSLTNSELIGNEMITEHLHPNVIGNWKIAEQAAYYTARKIFKYKGELEALSHEEAPVSDFDLMCAQKRILYLTSRPPYKKKITTYEKLMKSRYFDFLNKITGDYLENKLTWTEGHTAYAFHLSRNNDFEKAAKEINIISTVYPDYAGLYARFADSLSVVNEYLLADKFYKKALDVDPERIDLMSKRAFLLFFQKKYPFALEEMLKILDLNKEQGKLKPNEIIMTHKAIAKCYHALGMNEQLEERMMIIDSLRKNHD